MSTIKYILSSPKFDGKLIFGYSDGFLVFYENAATFKKPESYQWILSNLPLTVPQLTAMAAAIPGKAEPLPDDLTFDAFWTAYQKKVNRIRCEPLWNKLSEGDRIECLQSLKPYDGYLKRMNGRAKLDPENYLKRESFRNPWNTLTS
jgi:hypothetical protein